MSIVEVRQRVRSPFYTADEVAFIIRSTKNHVYTLIKSGSLPAQRIAGKWLIRCSALEKFLTDIPVGWQTRARPRPPLFSVHSTVTVKHN